MRRFEFVEGTSAKFWEAATEGSSLVVVYGRLGASGQRKEKSFASDALALREFEKKVAEKLREGYREVAGSAAPAPVAAVRDARAGLPPRYASRSTGDAAVVSAAKDALDSVKATLGRSSWVVDRAVRRARHALAKIAGLDPASAPAFAASLDGLMKAVVAANARERLSLTHAMRLLLLLDAKAFGHAVEGWGAAPAGPAASSIALLGRQRDALADDEFALRLGALLTDRRAQSAGLAKRWRSYASAFETHLAPTGASAKSFVKAIDTGGDAHLSQALARLRA